MLSLGLKAKNSKRVMELPYKSKTNHHLRSPTAALINCNGLQITALLLIRSAAFTTMTHKPLYHFDFERS